MFGLIIVLLILYVLFREVRAGPIDETNSKSYPMKDDDTKRILERMEWALLRNNRIEYVTRYLMWGLWVTFLGSFLFLGELPSAGVFLRNWIVVSIILLSLHGYYYWHSDKFSYFASLSGIEILRKRLGIEKSTLDNLDSLYDKKLIGSEAPSVFTHEDYGIGGRFPIAD